MKTENFTDILYDLLNESDTFDIASIALNIYCDNCILVELKDGSKFEIKINPTDLFV